MPKAKERIFRRGIYETEHGNAAYVSGPKATWAYDMDMATRIPIDMVTGKRLRDANDFDESVAND